MLFENLRSFLDTRCLMLVNVWMGECVDELMRDTK